MPTVQTQIRIDKNVKTQANTIFEALGLDMSSAVNIFLHQCILHNGIPFNVEIPKSAQYKTEVLEAMAEAKKLSCDKNAKRYKTFKDALNDIDMDYRQFQKSDIGHAELVSASLKVLQDKTLK